MNLSQLALVFALQVMIMESDINSETMRSILFAYFSNPSKSSTQNGASMYVKRLRYFLLYNVSVSYTLPFIDTPFEVFCLWSDEKRTSVFVGTSLAFTTGHVYRPISASGGLRSVWREGERFKDLV